MSIPNVLAARYASPAMADLWSLEGKVVLERRLWVAVLRAQRDLGVEVPDGALEAYEAVVDRVDLASIDARERANRHDVKARIEEFCELAGYEHVHKGMTSRDLTENVEQLQVRRSLELVRDRCVAALALLAERAGEHADTVMTGRSHNVPAQATTLGKRFANAGEELLQALARVEGLLARYPLRGIKGPVGTQQDLLDLFDGDATKVEALEVRVADHLGFPTRLDAVGQVYPRSLDLDVVSALVQVASGPSSLATTLRLMAGQELATEGFAPGQVGSSAMPHKMNSRSIRFHPCAPYQRCSNSGRVSGSNTSGPRAPNVRMSTSSRSPSVVTVRPEPLTTARDQPDPLERPQVLGHRGLTHVDRRRELRDRRLAGHQTSHDLPAGRIGQRRERRVELLRRHRPNPTVRFYNSSVSNSRRSSGQAGYILPRVRVCRPQKAVMDPTLSIRATTPVVAWSWSGGRLLPNAVTRSPPVGR